jgi:hypothetical protein
MSIKFWMSREGFIGGSPFITCDNAQVGSEDQARDAKITSFAPDDFNQRALVTATRHPELSIRRQGSIHINFA